MNKSTWNNQPATSEWNSADNWTPSGEPAETAVFTDSSQTAITFSPTGSASVGQIEFTENASAYTFTFGPSAEPALTITGQGVSNSSGKQQGFIVASTSSGYKDPQLKFTNSATAGGDDMFYCAGPETEQGYGGGVICFCNNATAGSASFKAWTGAAAPPELSTVGGEISFCDSATAESARFIIYGTLGTDGDTFGNVVFHDAATAADGSFTNVGGTVSGGDGGNTQFYDNATAAHGIFNNQGGTHSKANGGDVAFDGVANGGHGHFYNHAAKVSGAYGGVTSFNNNPPDMFASQGASAGNGFYFNYGARDGESGGGGHLEFSAKHGSPTGANATIVNYGSTIEDKSSAGHTIFSIDQPTDYFPTAGNATIWNHPGVKEGSAAGFTEFSVYGDGGNGGNTPTAGLATLSNLGGNASGATGGYTVFSGTSTAGNATLVAYGGTHGGYGGKIAFYDNALGGTARVHLFGNGELDIGSHINGVIIGELELTGGTISMQLGSSMATLTVTGEVQLKSSQTTFSFWKSDEGGFAFDTPYTLLTSPNLSGYTAECFSGNSIEGVGPAFAIVGNDLQVTFRQG
jgi:hypothetical protein